MNQGRHQWDYQASADLAQVNIVVAISLAKIEGKMEERTFTTASLMPHARARHF